MADEEIVHWIPDIPVPYGGSEARSFLEGVESDWQQSRIAHLAVESEGRLAGDMSLVRIDWDERVAEVGYWIAADFRRSGVATAALKLLCSWAFAQLGFERLELYVDPDNVASRRLAERCGFVEEGLLRSHTWKRGGGRSDSVVYGLLSSDPKARG